MVNQNFLDYTGTRLRLATLREEEGGQYIYYGSPNCLEFSFRIWEYRSEIGLTVPTEIEPKVEGPVSEQQIISRKLNW